MIIFPTVGIKVDCSPTVLETQLLSPNNLFLRQPHLYSTISHLFLNPRTMATTRAAESAAGKGMAAYRATSLFQPHHAREAIRDAHDGKIAPLTGLYLAFSTVPTARFIAPLGFDAVWIDWEHSACGVETMTTVRIRSASTLRSLT